MVVKRRFSLSKHLLIIKIYWLDEKKKLILYALETCRENEYESLVFLIFFDNLKFRASV